MIGLILSSISCATYSALFGSLDEYIAKIKAFQDSEAERRRHRCGL